MRRNFIPDITKPATRRVQVNFARSITSSVHYMQCVTHLRSTKSSLQWGDDPGVRELWSRSTTRRTIKYFDISKLQFHFWNDITWRIIEQKSYTAIVELWNDIVERRQSMFKYAACHLFVRIWNVSKGKINICLTQNATRFMRLTDYPQEFFSWIIIACAVKNRCMLLWFFRPDSGRGPMVVVGPIWW